ncbi:Retrotransposon nucleocapsid protein [Phytophthora palmivora]|uniref:Retrotransposon nucleocapsid protein n=1 Tax=Phytophthora palmivora TaxID=4796 RepID=A0A2P4XH35_9STRA|nr:Retrotransposon nucleocapsid protein [Phytophthora palmivora]
MFMDGLKVGPSRTQLFREHANTMEEAIQIALQEEYSHRQARTPMSVWQGHNASSGAVQGAPAAGASTGRVPMELVMDKYDLILGMPLLEKHEPWIDWRGKTIGASRSAVSDRALVSNVPISWVPKKVATELMRPKKYWELPAPTKVPNADSRRAVRDSTVAVPDGTDQAGNFGPQAAEAAEESAEDVFCVGSIVPHEVEETEKKIESAVCVSSVGNDVPHGVKKTSTSAEVSLSTSRVDNQVPHSESETPPARPNLEELSMKDFLAELKAREIAEMIDLVPGTKYCVTRLWSLPREQCEVIDAFFAEKAKSGTVRESKSPHSTPTFCVRKPNGKWCLVHAYYKLNNATVPAQTPIPHKDVLLNNMSGSTLYSVLDLVDGYYQILMRESNIPLTATYFDDIFVHSRAEDGQTAMEVHPINLRRVFAVMRASKLFVNIGKCVFAADEIKVLGCFVSRVGVRADPGKVKAIAAWPTPRSQKDLLKWLGLANYLHKYSAGYAELARHVSDLLKKDADWVWEQQHQDAYDSIKASLQHAPALALPDENKSFSVLLTMQ